MREFLRQSLPSWLSWSSAEIQDRPSDYSAGELPERYSPFLDWLARFIIGTLGGCVLVIPMIIMVFRPSLSKSLVTVSVAVVLFALALSLVFKTDNKDTITATATYAAVLVVFVAQLEGPVLNLTGQSKPWAWSERNFVGRGNRGKFDTQEVISANP